MSWLLALALLAGLRHGPPGIVEERTFQRSFPLEDLRGLTVDNLFGGITVVGDGGSGIRVEVSERIEADDAAWLERARRDVSLEFTRKGDRLVICADGPFREPDDCTEFRSNLRGETKYRVIYGIALRVPRSIDLSVGTIEGDLAVLDVRGRLEVSGVQGSVEITGAAGPTRAATVDGPLHVRFAQNPLEDSTFSTVSGKIEVAFRGDMSADLSFETMNGEVATDFEHRVLTPVPQRTESRGRGTTYRLTVEPTIRIGDGGPHHRFKSISGDITIRRN